MTQGVITKPSFWIIYNVSTLYDSQNNPETYLQMSTGSATPKQIKDLKKNPKQSTTFLLVFLYACQDCSWIQRPLAHSSSCSGYWSQIKNWVQELSLDKLFFPTPF